MVRKNCKQCGRFFWPNHNGNLCCSQRCRGRRTYFKSGKGISRRKYVKFKAEGGKFAQGTFMGRHLGVILRSKDKEEIKIAKEMIKRTKRWMLEDCIRNPRRYLR